MIGPRGRLVDDVHRAVRPLGLKAQHRPRFAATLRTPSAAWGVVRASGSPVHAAGPHDSVAVVLDVGLKLGLILVAEVLLRVELDPESGVDRFEDIGGAF